MVKRGLKLSGRGLPPWFGQYPKVNILFLGDRPLSPRIGQSLISRRTPYGIPISLSLTLCDNPMDWYQRCNSWPKDISAFDRWGKCRQCDVVNCALCTVVSLCSQSNRCNCSGGCSLRGASKLWCTGDSAVHHEVEGGELVVRTQAGSCVQVHQGGARGIGVQCAIFGCSCSAMHNL